MDRLSRSGREGRGGLQCATGLLGRTAGLADLLESAAAAAGADDIACTDSSDVAVIIYTSGTTGSPKGAALTHDNLMWNARIFGDAVDLREGDVALAALPFFHSFGQTC